MRVIAGSAKRIALTSPKGFDTRPTSDRLKENLFNIISKEIYGATFLDIFCGSGAIGIEALSRGAEKVVFVDNGADAVKSVKDNLAKTKFHAEVLHMTAEKAVEVLGKRNARFNIIFLDPPYGSQILSETIKQISQARLLSENGKIIVETDADFETDEFYLIEKRAYGRAKLLFYMKEHMDDNYLSGQF